MMNLETPVSQLNRIGASSAKRLEHLGILTARDLLFYFPARHDDYSRIVPISDIGSEQTVTIKGRVELVAGKRAPRWRRVKFITEALISDESGRIKALWFNQPFMTRLLAPGDMVYLSGRARLDRFGPQIINPIYEKITGQETRHTARLVPIYHITEGLSERQIRFLIGSALDLAKFIPEWLPEEILEKFDLAPIQSAVKGIHFPADKIDLAKSSERIKFDELFLLQIKAERSRQERIISAARPLPFHKKEIQEFAAGLPFTLTRAQKMAAWEIFQDIARPIPMNRLLSGDVGSGKTVVAAAAIYNAFLSGARSALLAPTEILAEQHYQSLKKLLGAKLSVGLLTGKSCRISGYDFLSQSKSGERKEFLEKMKRGEIAAAVGTHALLSPGVEFKNLDLVIVDEQHRFGVEQRQAIKAKGRAAHFLSMTATPIPRSLALAMYGDLDISTINEMPLGRKKIMSRLVEPFNRAKAYGFIREQIKKGRQAFVICPLIELDEDAMEPEPQSGSVQGKWFGVEEKKCVMAEYQKLKEKIFPDLRVGFLHGRLKKEEKDAAMDKFRKGETDILVSTSVVEVGVDIPNASVMMIEGAERFGLAQLHQFRGRVGRSIHQSYCLLFTGTESVASLARLKFFEKENDGFKLAEKDLELRGPGEVYGIEQSGLVNLKMAGLLDTEIIKKARQAAKMVIGKLDEYPRLLDRVNEWEKKVHLE